MAIKKAAREGDPHTCEQMDDIPHIGGEIIEGAKTVTIEGKPAARVGDPVDCLFGSLETEIVTGSKTVFIEDKAAAMVSSETGHGSVVSDGASSVFIGDEGPGHIYIGGNGNPVHIGENVYLNCRPGSAAVAGRASYTDAFCEFRDFRLQCSHAERSFELEISNGKPNYGTSYQLHVIAGDKDPEHIKIHYGGKCHHPNPPAEGAYCPSIHFSGVDRDEIIQGERTVAVYSSPNTALTNDFGAFFQQWLIPKSDPHVYRFNPLICPSLNEEVPIESRKAQLSNYTATVHAYAYAEWRGEVSVGYVVAADEDIHYQGLRREGHWQLTGEIAVKRNREQWTITGENHTLFNGVQSFLDHVLPYFGAVKTRYGKIRMQWPNLTLSGGMKTVESNNSHTVDIEGQLAIGMNPLLGIEAETDILDWLSVVAGAGFGHFVNEARKQAKKGAQGKNAGISATLEAILKIGAQINGTIAWNKPLSEDWRVEGEVVGEIPISLEGEVSAETYLWRIKASGGMRMGAESGIAVICTPTTINDKPAIDTQFRFNGLIVYYAVFVEVGMDGDKQGEESMKPPTEPSKPNRLSLQKQESKMVFKPKHWPNEHALQTRSLDEGEF